ncbi:MAG: HPF/RaiA family ribosome-associated protein [Bryobacterales bacterium]|nr:HPF/RaiA family ribosome-associated protein [Bryobacterales bacterium]
MRLLIRGQQTGWTDDLRRHAERRVHFALSRFSPSIGLVTLDLRDSPTALDDLGRTCRIVVHLVPRGNVLVEETQKDTSSAIDQAAECAGRAVRRALERDREWEADPTQPKATGGPKS